MHYTAALEVRENAIAFGQCKQSLVALKLSEMGEKASVLVKETRLKL